MTKPEGEGILSKMLGQLVLGLVASNNTTTLGLLSQDAGLLISGSLLGLDLSQSLLQLYLSKSGLVGSFLGGLSSGLGFLDLLLGLSDLLSVVTLGGIDKTVPVTAKPELK